MLLPIKNSAQAYYRDDVSVFLLQNALKLSEVIDMESIDMIFADPPYFLSNGGITCQAGKMVSVNKAEWDKGFESIDKKHKFNKQWIRVCKGLLKPNGTIWISGTMHNIYSIGMALEQEGFKILNNITWQKANPPPNLGCRCFTHSTETVLWAKLNGKKAHHYFDYSLMKEENGGKQMKDVWMGALTSKKEKTEGNHPTQKPRYLLDRIINASTVSGDVVLDPFCGSGTTGVSAKALGRRFIGSDIRRDYLDLSIKRMGLVFFNE